MRADRTGRGGGSEPLGRRVCGGVGTSPGRGGGRRRSSPVNMSGPRCPRGPRGQGRQAGHGLTQWPPAGENVISAHATPWLLRKMSLLDTPGDQRRDFTRAGERPRRRASRDVADPEAPASTRPCHIAAAAGSPPAAATRRRSSAMRRGGAREAMSFQKTASETPPDTAREASAGERPTSSINCLDSALPDPPPEAAARAGLGDEPFEERGWAGIAEGVGSPLTSPQMKIRSLWAQEVAGSPERHGGTRHPGTSSLTPRSSDCGTGTTEDHARTESRRASRPSRRADLGAAVAAAETAESSVCARSPPKRRRTGRHSRVQPRRRIRGRECGLSDHFRRPTGKPGARVHSPATFERVEAGRAAEPTR